MTAEVEDSIPSLLPGLTLIDTDAGIVVHGGPRTVLLPAVSLQPDAIDVLRRIAAGQAPEATAKASVESLRSALHAADLVDRSKDGSDRTPIPAIRYYRRVLGARACDGADEHRLRLRLSHVLVIGVTTVQTRTIARQLQAAGIGRADIAQIGKAGAAVRQLSRRRAERQLVVLECSGADTGQKRALVAIAEHALRSEFPVLYSSATADRHTLGPVAMPWSSLCAACVVRSITAPADHEMPQPLRAALARMSAARTAHHVTCLLGAIGEVEPLGVVRRWSLERPNPDRLAVTSDQDCPVCGADSSDGCRWRADPLISVEVAGRRVPAQLAGAPATTRTEARARSAAATERVRWEARPTRRIEDLCSDETPHKSISCDGRRLAQLLTSTVPVPAPAREPKPSRVRPPGVDRHGIAQAYIVTTGDPFGLPGSAFRHDRERGEVEAVGRGRRQPRGAAAHLIERIRTEQGVAVVITAGVARVARHYGPSAVRLAGLEGGAALARLGRIATSLGCDIERIDRWDAELHRLLGLSEVQELVVALAILTDPAVR